MDPHNLANLNLGDSKWRYTMADLAARSAPSSPHLSEDEDVCGDLVTANHDVPSLWLLQANSTALNTDTIPHITHEDSGSPKDPGIVLERQRKAQKPRQRRVIICQFRGSECPFIKPKEGAGFRNVAELKEDGLRHLNPYQCERCGKRFGKRYGLTRHLENKNTCNSVDRNTPGIFWVTKQFLSAVTELEKAKGYREVVAAIQRCNDRCALPKKMERRTKKQAQRRTARHPLVLMGQTISAQSGGSPIPTESGSANAANSSPEHIWMDLQGHPNGEEHQQMPAFEASLTNSQSWATDDTIFNDADVAALDLSDGSGSNAGIIDPALSQDSHVEMAFRAMSLERIFHLGQEIDATQNYSCVTGSDFNTNVATVRPGGTEFIDDPGNPLLASPLPCYMENRDYPHHVPAVKDPQLHMDTAQAEEMSICAIPQSEIDNWSQEKGSLTSHEILSCNQSHAGFIEGPTYNNPEASYSPARPPSYEVNLSQWNLNESEEPLPLMPAPPNALVATGSNPGTLEFPQTTNSLEFAPYSYQQMLAGPRLYHEQGMLVVGPDADGETANHILSATRQFD